MRREEERLGRHHLRQLWLWEPREPRRRRGPEGVDLGWRPHTYWEWPTQLSPNIKGEQRRRWLRDSLAGTGTPLEEHPAAAFADALEEPLRQSIGHIHPSYMGGEYLPGYRRGEVEIARVSLKSTTWDVISLRARPLYRGIGYRIVDEYPGDHRWVCRPRTSGQPLTLRRLIRVLDTAELQDSNEACLSRGLIERYWRDPESSLTPEEAVDFAQPCSDFYPQLATWYAHRGEIFARRWGATFRRTRGTR